MSWYRKAAEQGDADAQIEIGWMYHNGNGVLKDFAQAIDWYRNAAEQGHPGAQFNLGLMYFRAEGVAKQDLVTSYMWFNLSASQGDGNAKLGRDTLEKHMTVAQIAEAQKLSREWKAKPSK